MILATVMRQGNIKSEEIKEALYQLEEYNGISYPITFDENGDLESASYSVAEFKNGEAIPIIGEQQ
jgi:ABC-type branched-subunit amino acid transport system substrate-binding protein